jgi:alpha-tubulin suppressor-like RCC1 family protein
MALKEDGTVWAWGRNSGGQLGNPDSGSGSDTPVQVVGEGGTGTLSEVVAVAAGWGHTMALKEDGTVWAWGSNSSGQLGNPSAGSESGTPVQVVGEGGTGTLSGVGAVAGGSVHTVVLKEDGTVWTWGSNGYGQLGNPGAGIRSDTPVQVLGYEGAGVIEGVIAVAGSNHTVALKEDGTVWAWGYNYKGQLGDGNEGNDSGTPVPAGFFYIGWCN